MEKSKIYDVFIMGKEKVVNGSRNGGMNIGFTQDPKGYFKRVLKDAGYRKSEVLFQSIDRNRNTSFQAKIWQR